MALTTIRRDAARLGKLLAGGVNGVVEATEAASLVLRLLADMLEAAPDAAASAVIGAAICAIPANEFIRGELRKLSREAASREAASGMLGRKSRDVAVRLRQLAFWLSPVSDAVPARPGSPAYLRQAGFGSVRGVKQGKLLTVLLESEGRRTKDAKAIEAVWLREKPFASLDRADQKRLQNRLHQLQHDLNGVLNLMSGPKRYRVIRDVKGHWLELLER